MEELQGRISASIPLKFLNASGEITSVNDAFERLFGSPGGDQPGSARWPFLSADHEEKFKSIVRRAFLGDAPEPFDLPVTCSDNTIRDIRWNAMLVQDWSDPHRDVAVVFGTGAGSWSSSFISPRK